MSTPTGGSPDPDPQDRPDPRDRPDPHRGEVSPHDRLTVPTSAVLDGYFWERRRRGALVPIAVGVIGLTALGLVQEFPVRHGMEQDLTARSTQALRDAGVSGVRVEFSGRDGTLTGTVTSPAERDSAVSAVRHVRGVRVAHDRLRGPGGHGRTPGGTSTPSTTATPPRTAPAVTARLDGGRLTLSGTVPSSTERARLLAAVRAALHPTALASRLSVDRGVSSAGLDALPDLLQALGRDATVTVELSGGRVSLTGTVASARRIRASVAAATALTGSRDRVTDHLTVAPTAAVAAALRSLEPVTFRFASSTPTVPDEATLRRLAGVLRAAPGVRVEVDGYTDDIGPTAVNEALSRDRARAVAQRLAALGVDPSRLVVRGFGERDPKLPNTSPANRAANRRVEFRVLP